jgi:hypothetical protein
MMGSGDSAFHWSRWIGEALTLAGGLVVMLVIVPAATIISSAVKRIRGQRSLHLRRSSRGRCQPSDDAKE